MLLRSGWKYPILLSSCEEGIGTNVTMNQMVMSVPKGTKQENNVLQENTHAQCFSFYMAGHSVPWRHQIFVNPMSSYKQLIWVNLSKKMSDGDRVLQWMQRKVGRPSNYQLFQQLPQATEIQNMMKRKLVNEGTQAKYERLNKYAKEMFMHTMKYGGFCNSNRKYTTSTGEEVAENQILATLNQHVYLLTQVLDL